MSDFRIVRPVTITDSVLTSSSVADALAAWSADTAYTTGNDVYRVIDNVHVHFEALQNGTNKVPEDEPTYWQNMGPTNRWAMFDKVIQSQTEDADDITVEFAVPGRVDTVALLNISGQTATITVEDAVDGIVYDEEYSLTSTEGINNWAAYFREPIERLDKLIVSDLPPYANPTVTVAIEDTGATVACGALILGRSKVIGQSEAGASLGIIDYSVKETDDFGDISVVERAFSDTAEFRILVDNSDVDMIKKLLTSYRATPILYVGSNAFTSTAVYGFYREFNIEIAYPDHSLATISLEGLT